eukprot:4493249-Pleurochrysis_carterae.AAC.3
MVIQIYPQNVLNVAQLDLAMEYDILEWRLLRIFQALYSRTFSGTQVPLEWLSLIHDITYDNCVACVARPRATDM